ncbi:ribonucleotide reductase [Puniceispirillum phage HMO-2011]|uniref:ribonucleotide reductase n=1 Tax=Puniceispirillum phage HMO-2011 TaxID=948071 RepID=UPI000351D0A3|nr:ribonucleotide reductase [Puniceispirillum phage HMO-2011]ADW08436.1 adenosylcobalamin-dependent ribonucleoside-triphosphate reductase [Puniceispirillum phage HMO-2011]
MLSNHLPTDYQNFIALSRYARWKEDEQRRETWGETVTRYFDYMANHLNKNYSYKLDSKLRNELEEAVLNQDIMPSMRALMTSGPALDRCHVGAYNCSYVPVDSPRAFDETMYILMCGTGVGFSVERHCIDKLPVVNEDMHPTDTVIKVGDSRPGWAKSLRELISLLYAGQVPQWDTSEVRPAGERLKTFGGRASGPAPLEELFQFVIDKFKGAAGRKLFPIECHDIMCKIGEVVVVGGVRRSALISLSNLNDDQMAHAKSGKWYDYEKQRGLANNSVAYKNKPEMGTFMREWLSLYESKSGERGIFNRQSAKKQAAKNGRRDAEHDFGCNPCSEIILRPYQFCNLSEVVARAGDTQQTLSNKVRLATILGTFQSTLTNFKYIRNIWKKNTEEERLLGVSLTGIMDNDLLNGKSAHLGMNIGHTLEALRDEAVKTNEVIAKKLGIPQSAAITCVKPSGTVSQLVDSASGIHARHNPHYIRTVRGDNKDPLTQFLMSQGIPAEPDVFKPDSTTVFSFPMKSPTGAVTRTEMTAIEQLDLWLLYQRHWCEHKPSVTITVKEDEWFEVGAWVYKNFDEVSGISFLPFDDHTYQQAPYQDIDEETYNELLTKMPDSVDWSRLQDFEKEDTTSGGRELACTAGVCEVVDLNAT